MNLKRLTKLRIKHGLNQEDVAEIISVARTTYAMYEQGKREMDYETLIKLADYYKVSLDYLFGRSDLEIHPESFSKDEIDYMTNSLFLYKRIKDEYNF